MELGRGSCPTAHLFCVMNCASIEMKRLLLDRARDLIIHGSAHRGANGVAMPTDEDDQDGHFFFNHPERWATPLPRCAQPLLLLFRSNPPMRGGGRKKGEKPMAMLWRLVVGAKSKICFSLPPPQWGDWI